MAVPPGLLSGIPKSTPGNVPGGTPFGRPGTRACAGATARNRRAPGAVSGIVAHLRVKRGADVADAERDLPASEPARLRGAEQHDDPGAVTRGILEGRECRLIAGGQGASRRNRPARAQGSVVVGPVV